MNKDEVFKNMQSSQKVLHEFEIRQRENHMQKVIVEDIISKPFLTHKDTKNKVYGIKQEVKNMPVYIEKNENNVQSNRSKIPVNNNNKVEFFMSTEMTRKIEELKEEG